MSSQGTGSIEAGSFEELLLGCWGLWARGDIGLWYNRVELLRKTGGVMIFGEDDMMHTDRIVAGLSTDHKNTLKCVFIRDEGAVLDEQRRNAAVDAFAESLQRDGANR